MKKILIPISALFVVGLSHAQTTNTENYVQTRVYLEPVTTSSSTAKQIETVQYFDGLGRPKQVVNVKASPLGKDVVTHIEYDGFGRQVKDYLPVPQSGTMNGAIVPSPLANATQPSIYSSEKIYSEKILESSPLDRVQQQIQVGTDWSNKPVKFDYDANTSGEVIKFITTTVWENGATKSVLTQSGTYGTAQLYKNTVTDEDGNKTIEFKNGEGQTLLVRKVINDVENADTYYVYNEYNQLAFVVPPLASIATIDETTLKNLCYQYRYDSRNRLVEKKLPGKGWEYMVYDKADRLIMTQDANMRISNRWLITKYDQFGRVAYTGFLIAGSRESMQSQAGGGIIIETRDNSGFTMNGTQIYYSNHYFFEMADVLSVSYYDTYPPGSPTIPTQVLGQNVLQQDAQNSNISTKSLPVASYVKNIEDNNWTKNYTWYDSKGRVIGSHSVNHLGGYTKTESELDFAGVTKQSVTRHKRLDTDTEKIITENFTHDHQNRLLTHTHKVDNNPIEYLAQNKYNELSQLESKKVGGVNLGSGLQTVDYLYNIRGWMTKINDPTNLGTDLFGYEMKYTNPANTSFVYGRYNGNIAEVDWKTSVDLLHRRYSYHYDSLNRLVFGHYSEPFGTIPQENHFGESIEYDVNGNITHLYRNAKNTTTGWAMQIDDLGYVYENNNNKSNRLSTVTDSSQNPSGYPLGGNTISYDDNGNITSHPDKGIGLITYNYLNLPSIITTGSNKFKNQILYTYRADGTKLKKTLNNPFLSSQTEIDYLDGFQYLFNNDLIVCIGCPAPILIPVLQFVPTSEGYFDFEKNKYIYNYSDHLGNTRLSYFNGGNGIEVLEENNYYPFGLKHQGYNQLSGNSSYQYKYNGKELQETGMYDYGARFYMPDIGRWGVVDPLAEKMTRHSPYNYAFNNPIRFIDPDGRQGKDIIILTENGSFKASKDLMYQTEEGKRIWDKYGTSKTDDVYIKSSTFSSKDSRTGAETYSLAGDESFVKDGKVNDIGKTYSAMGSFDGVDISKSGDKKVHLMAINESFFPNEASDSYSKSEVTSSGKTITSEYNLSDLSKIVYHEFKAHIEDRTGDADKDHRNLGESTFKGYVRPNSPMDKFENQLNKVLRTLNEKKYNEKK